MTLTPFKMSEPARMRVEPLGRRNEPGIRGDDSRSLCRGEDDEIVGDDEGVRGKGEAGGEADPDSGEVFEGTLPNTSLATTGLGGRSTTDGLLLGMGDSQGLLRDSSGGRIPSTGSSTDRRSSALRTSLSPCSSDTDGPSSATRVTSQSVSSMTTTERKAVGGLSLTMDHRMVVPLSGRCGGKGRLSVLALRRLRAEWVKFSAQLSPWRATLSVAEKQSGQHGRRGTVTRGVCGSGGRRAV